jgi:glutamate---cysteine ligase / carboxylate-amine ligase
MTRHTQDVAVRKIGVEEELILVDPATGELTGVSQRAVRAHEADSDQVTVGVRADGDESQVEEELFLQQIEVSTSPVESVTDLMREIRRGRKAVATAAEAAGAAAVAVPTPVLVDPQEDVTPKPRYQRIYDEFGEISRQSLACAMHVHVDVSSEDEAVAVIDRIRPWLPVLTAVSANSPYWRGRDTGYASWRTQTWTRWPSNGARESFGDVETYRWTTQKMIDWGAAFDPAMVYFDVRLSEKYPTVEVRVADVCTEVEDAALVAALARALVATAADEDHGDGSPWRGDLLRVAAWRASRYGLSGQLVHPETFELAPARHVVDALAEHVGESLDQAGDREFVADTFEQVLSRGTGAGRQRAIFEATGELRAVVKDLRERTAASWHEE